MQLYGWLSSSDSKLYDPMLHRMVHKIMRKVFLQLLVRLDKLGCKVVHADFQKLILTTDKRSYDDARSHIDFVLSQIKNEDIFRHLDCTAGEFWQILLWKDSFNYAGIPESNPDKMSLHFNVIDHLP
jgi:DNA polymerase epsilon subunit 1